MLSFKKDSFIESKTKDCSTEYYSESVTISFCFRNPRIRFTKISLYQKLISFFTKVFMVKLHYLINQLRHKGWRIFKQSPSNAKTIPRRQYCNPNTLMIALMRLRLPVSLFSNCFNHSLI